MSDSINKKQTEHRKIYIIVIMDGASDHLRIKGKSPLEIAKTPNLNSITEQGALGLMQTLYSDLPKDSVVAQLGLLGYDPYKYFPMGRSFFEVPNDVIIDPNDLIFRANLVHFSDNVLKSYNGSGISTEEATGIVRHINSITEKAFPEFQMYNNSAFRNTLIIKNVGKLNFKLNCWEPHEEEGKQFLNQNLISAAVDHPIIGRVNSYINFIYQNTGSSKANGIFPWGYSNSISLPDFSKKMKGCIIGAMDFLNGFSRAMNLDLYQTGNGNWDTNYKEKGKLVLEQIEKEDYDFIYCHINGPDEASHINDVEKKIYSIEQIDKHILGPLCKVWKKYPERFGAIAISPDHYTNINLEKYQNKRHDAHSLDAVPFVIWNNRDKDEIKLFNEKTAPNGFYKRKIYSHLELLELMGIGSDRIGNREEPINNYCVK